MIQFRTRLFPTARRLARIYAMLERLLHHCRACGGDVPEYIEHVLLECPRWECHRRHFGTLASDFNGFMRRFATSPEGKIALFLDGVPPSLHGAIHFVGNGRYSQLWRLSLNQIAFFVAYESHSQNVLLREMGFILLLALPEWADARKCIHFSSHVIGSFLVGETLILASLWG
jgi:hypothetical protein